MGPLEDEQVYEVQVLTVCNRRLYKRQLWTRPQHWTSLLYMLLLLCISMLLVLLAIFKHTGHVLARSILNSEGVGD